MKGTGGPAAVPYAAVSSPPAFPDDRAGAVVPPPRPLTRRRRRVFAAVSILFPLGLLLLAEGGLRLAGFGHSYQLFVPHHGTVDHLSVNRQAVRRFVADQDEAPRLWIRAVPFERVKGARTFRIFVQGGSTAAGYPYGYGASPAGMLQQRLQRTFPERKIEVVTTAMSAVNTYTLLDFSREILAQGPDAVVIYAGHNEYVGLLGVGSGFSMGRRRPLVLAALALKDVRLLQLARGLFDGLASDDEATARAARGERRTLMATIVAEDRIAHGSTLYRRGLAQYRANLDALLARYRRAGVPVFIGTLVSNERDQPPFISGHGEGVDLTAWRRRFAAGQAALAAGDAAAALAEFEAAVALDDTHAGGHFARGRALDRLGRFAEARRTYLAAKDRDQLRFRAPEEINAIIRRVAAEQGALVVEVQRAFHGAAADGIVGHDLMLEHLHPNLHGYFVLADAFYRAFAEAGMIGSWERPVPAAQARREVPVTRVDRLYGEWRIGRLTSDWPFSSSRKPFHLPRSGDRVVRIARGYYHGRLLWADAMRALLDHHRAAGEVVEAARVAALLADAFPHRLADQWTAAQLLAAAGRTDTAVYRHRADALAHR